MEDYKVTDNEQASDQDDNSDDEMEGDKESELRKEVDLLMHRYLIKDYSEEYLEDNYIKIFNDLSINSDTKVDIPRCINAFMDTNVSTFDQQVIMGILCLDFSYIDVSDIVPQYVIEDMCEKGIVLNDGLYFKVTIKYTESTKRQFSMAFILHFLKMDLSYTANVNLLDLIINCLPLDDVSLRTLASNSNLDSFLYKMIDEISAKLIFGRLLQFKNDLSDRDQRIINILVE